MIIETILYGIIFLGLFIGSYTDLKTREVPDWLSFSLIFSGLGLRLLFSTITLDKSIFIEGFVGFLIFVVLGYMMYYSGQWGGGDSKLLMGIGALVGLDFHFLLKSTLAIFFINILLAGAAYGMLWIVALAIIYRNRLGAEAIKLFRATTTIRNTLFVTTPIFIVFLLLLPSSTATLPLQVLLFALAIAPLFLYTTWLGVKSIENLAFYKDVEPEKLTEGDWIAKDVIVDGRRIVGSKDLGVTALQIKKLRGYYHQGKIGKVTVKEGIPFVPSFLIGFIMTVIWGNWLRGLL